MNNFLNSFALIIIFTNISQPLCSTPPDKKTIGLWTKVAVYSALTATSATLVILSVFNMTTSDNPKDQQNSFAAFSVGALGVKYFGKPAYTNYCRLFTQPQPTPSTTCISPTEATHVIGKIVATEMQKWSRPPSPANGNIGNLVPSSRSSSGDSLNGTPPKEGDNPVLDMLTRAASVAANVQWPAPTNNNGLKES